MISSWGWTMEVTVEHVTLRAWLSIQKHVATTAMKPTGQATNGQRWPTSSVQAGCWIGE